MRIINQSASPTPVTKGNSFLKPMDVNSPSLMHTKSNNS